jgi:alpha-tubulin suppressor-like RCC1 family protein
MFANSLGSTVKGVVRLRLLVGRFAALPCTREAVLAVGLSLAACSAPLAAQTITLNLSDSARAFVAPNAKLTVPVSVDLTSAGALNIASLQAGLTWGASRLTFDSIRVVSSTGFSLTPNTGNAASGSVTFNTFSATALAASGPLFNVYFTAGATSGGTRVALAPTVAGTDLGQDILTHLAIRNVDVCVATRGLWGDVTDDGIVNIVDAQQIARFSVGLSVANPTALTARGDVTADGVVNIIDAQQIARFSVALSASARVNTQWLSAAPVTTVAVTAATDSLGQGQSVTLSAALQDSTAASVAGCYPVTWASSDTTVATVSSAGVVTAVRGGTATISATSGGKTGSATVVVTITGLPAFVGSSIAVGFSHACGLTTAGSAYCWGDNSSGQLGDNTLTRRTTPVAVGGGLTFASIVAGMLHTCGLTSSGAAYCWGHNSYGELGNNSTTQSLVPVAVAGGLTFAALGLGGYDTCGLTIAGAAYCWGWNPNGQLGNNSTTNSGVPVAVSGGLTFKRIAVGYGTTCALAVSGAAWCWGNNGVGGLGNGTTGSPALQPVAVVGGHGFAELESGWSNSCGLTTDGAVYCWGSSGAFFFGSSPSLVASSGSYQTLNVGGGLAYSSCGITVVGALRCWGNNLSGQLGDGTSVDRLVPTAVVATGIVWASVSMGGGTTCAVTVAGLAYCWGSNASGQVGNGTILAFLTPILVAGGPTFTAVGAGQWHACGLTNGGAAYCWGYNSDGELGNNGTMHESSVPAAVAGGLTITALSVGGFHTCGLTVGSAAYCWGQGNPGQLGNNSTVSSSVPVAVAGGLAFTALGAGEWHTCGVTSGGAAYCWGQDNSGQLGNSSTTNSSVPVAVAGGLTFTAISAGSQFTCGLTGGGAAYCWGQGNSGQLGNNSTTNSSVPVAVTGGLTFTALRTGFYHACGLTSGGAVYCWGYGGDGELGNNSFTSSSVPVAVAGGLTFTAISAGSQFTCGLTSGGASYCWGYNYSGQLGNNSTTYSTMPVAVAGGLTFTALGAGATSACGVTSGGATYCWGDNTYGQVGQPLPWTPQAVVGGLVFRAP